jgi:hypothetical protein
MFMGQLLFKKCFVEPIRSGRKSTTLRRWASPRVVAGERCFSRGVGWLMIDSVEPIDSLDSLTDADARADGFDDLRQMKEALRRIYPDTEGDGRSWFRVAFRLDPTAVMLQALNSALLQRRAEKTAGRRRDASG